MIQKVKVLVLNKCCSDEKCTKDLPCEDCLKRCEIYEIPESTISALHNHGTYKYLKELKLY
jgi:reverse gyrase